MKHIIPPQKWRCPKCGRFGKLAVSLNGKDLCAACVDKGWNISPINGAYYKAKLTGKLTITVTHS